MTAAVIAGSFADYRLVKSRSVLQVIVEIPIEQQGAAFAALGYPLPGTEIPVAVARMNSDPTRHLPAPVAGDRSGATAGETAPKFKSLGERSVIRAALLPRDERFRAWAAQPGFRPMTEEQAEDFIRIRCCDGNSRRLIAEVPEYMDRFLAMETEFKMDVGELARPR